MEKKLKLLRNNIDEIDQKILSLITKRLEIAEKIGIAKQEHSQIYRPLREAEIIKKLEKTSPKFAKRFIFPIWRILMSANIYLQKPSFKILATKNSFEDANIFSNNIFKVESKSSAKESMNLLLEDKADLLIISYNEINEIYSLLGEHNQVFISGSYPIIRSEKQDIKNLIIIKGTLEPKENEVNIFKDIVNNKIIRKNLVKIDCSLVNEEKNIKFLGSVTLFNNN